MRRARLKDRENSDINRLDLNPGTFLTSYATRPPHHLVFMSESHYFSSILFSVVAAPELKILKSNYTLLLISSLL